MKALHVRERYIALNHIIKHKNVEFILLIKIKCTSLPNSLIQVNIDYLEEAADWEVTVRSNNRHFYFQDHFSTFSRF